MAQSQSSIEDRIEEIYKNSPLATGRAPGGMDWYRWQIGGSGYIGLDVSDCMALGLMFELEQRHNAPISRAIQRFIEAHCIELPPYWGERGVTNPPSGDKAGTE